MMKIVIKLGIAKITLKLLNCPDNTGNYNINEILLFKESFINVITIFVR